jgi:hypothetical protein
MPGAKFYAEAVDFVHERMPRRTIIVNSNIVNAIKGRFGDVHATERAKGSKIFINPLMSQYWAFDLEVIAQKNRYLERIRTTETYS